MAKRRAQQPADYHRMTWTEKRQVQHDQAGAEPPVTCPGCETQVAVEYMPKHLETCPGKREPHQRSKWVSWADVLALGVRRRTFLRWIKAGSVTAKGEAGERTYLLRDVMKQIALHVTRATIKARVTSVSPGKKGGDDAR